MIKFYSIYYFVFISYRVILQEEWKRKIDGIGGVFHAKVKKGIYCTDKSMKIENLEEK